MARWVHLFPFRTEKLSTSAPMVLVPQGTGRVGRSQHLVNKRSRLVSRSRAERGGVGWYLWSLSREACRSEVGQGTGLRRFERVERENNLY